MMKTLPTAAIWASEPLCQSLEHIFKGWVRWERLRAHQHVDYDLLFVDVHLAQAQGWPSLSQQRCYRPHPPMLGLASAHEGRLIAEAYRHGAADVLLLPLDRGEALLQLEQALSRLQSRPDQGLDPCLEDQPHAPIGLSAPMQHTLSMIARVAPTPLPVMLSGETGTGKGVLARHLHAISPRATGPFMAINCAALTPTLIESELFGHEKGAFTGAQGRRIGLLEAANGGTLFLDEINSAPLDVQVRLLHFIQERRFMRVGGTQEIEVDVRLVAATNQPLKPLVENGQFREDLYYRLNVFPVDVPPLRQRTEDIPALGLRILKRLAPIIGKEVHACGPGVLETLQRYAWPGNVREFENVLQRALVLARGDRIELGDLPSEITHPGGPLFTSCGQNRTRFDLAPNATLSEVERAWIQQTLQACNGNRTLAAERLGIDPSTLWRKLKNTRN